MTTSSTTRPDRATDPICPSWCSGHDDAGYQDWFPYVNDSLVRDHDDEGAQIAGVAVHITQMQSLMTGMEPARVWVAENHADVETHRLTPDQARKLAAAIIAAADRIESEAAR